MNKYAKGYLLSKREGCPPLGLKGPRVDRGASAGHFLYLNPKKIYIYFLTVIGN